MRRGEGESGSGWGWGREGGGHWADGTGSEAFGSDTRSHFQGENHVNTVALAGSRPDLSG